MTSTRHVTEEDRFEIWDNRLDGCSIAFICRYKVDLSRAVVKAVLAEPVPDSLRDDDRVRYNARFAWVSVIGRLETESGQSMPMIFVRLPLFLTQAAFRKGLRCVASELRELHPGIRLGEAMEGIESSAAFLFVSRKGYLGWDIDMNGDVRAMTVPPHESPTLPALTEGNPPGP